MVTYDVALFKNLLYRLHTLIQTSITFFDENFEGTVACTSPMNPLCRLIKDHEAFRCAETDKTELAYCKCSNCPDHYYSCHFGMKEMAFKMENHNETYGYILVGPFRNSENDEAVLQKIESFSLRHGVDKEKMLQAYYATTCFSEEKFEAIKVIIQAMFDYAVNKNIVSMKHTLFETVITSYVDAHLGEDLSIPALCNHFYLSQKQLYSIIKKATGLSPKQYVIQQRIAQAKRLIATTETPMQEIAEAVGIPDYSYFIKVFKAATGHTPTYYRKRI